ncbi:MAG: hypothetical protein E6G44_05310 [Actinobacteria bacterium]|nr:MAG: hypothetical protein E6G44_05310 [Actinomycetota bacterium]
MLGAVREDIRQTLRTGWIDPTLDAIAAYPVFFTAAWSAIRPNVGKSFLVLARSLRTEAADAVRSWVDVPDLRKRLDGELSEGEVTRIVECARAAHLVMAKTQIVVHGFTRAVRRERLKGTGREEPPVRRGIPEWQRWMSFQPAPERAQDVLQEAARLYSLPGPPAAFRLFARWPSALLAAWSELRLHLGGDDWKAASLRLRRMTMAGVSSLPHPVDLQWAALRARGFEEQDRVQLAEALGEHDAAMPAQTLTAAFLWATFGAPDVGSEG